MKNCQCCCEWTILDYFVVGIGLAIGLKLGALLF